jgi:hypothetical protein
MYIKLLGSGIPLSPILGTAARLIIIWRKFVSIAWAIWTVTHFVVES